MTFKNNIYILVIALAISSCSNLTTSKVPSIEYDKWREASLSGKADIDKDWWNNFEDEKLTKVIEVAQNNNKDIKIAIERINQARANESSVLADNLPVVNANLSAGRNKNSSNLTSRPITNKFNNNFKAEFDSTWEINIFGIEPATRAAAALTEKAQEDLDQVYVSLYGEVASSYFNLRKAQLQLSLNSTKLDKLEEKLKLQRALFEAGNIDGIELATTEKEISGAKFNMETLNNSFKQQKYMLNSLCGVKPGELDDIINSSFSYTVPSKNIFVSAPEDVLKNRPDVRSSLKNLLYSSAAKDVAITNLLPKISISGLLGFESGRAGNLLESGSNAWGATGSLIAPILDYKKIHADIKDTKSKEREAIASYEKTVLAALSDVESSLASYKSSVTNLEFSKSQFLSSKDQESLTKDRYEKGLNSYIDSVDSSSSRVDNEVSLEEAKFENLIQLVRVYKALGGGWGND